MCLAGSETGRQQQTQPNPSHKPNNKTNNRHNNNNNNNPTRGRARAVPTARPRARAGCQLLQQPGWEWPHDAVVFPPLEPFGTWRTASAAWSVVGAELLGKTARVFEVRLGGGVAATSKSVYG